MDKDTIQRLWYAQNYMGYREFYDCFHNEYEKREDRYGLSMHLWQKYAGFNNDLLRLWGALDLDNRAKLLAYLNSNEFDARYKKGMCLE